MEILIEQIKNNDPTLTRVHQHIMSASNTFRVINLLQRNHVVTDVILYGNMNDTNMTALLHMLQINRRITSLELSLNNINDARGIDLANILKTNQTLRRLDIIRSDVSTNAFKTIADALRLNTTLTSLSLHGNNAGDDGVIALADALKTNQTLISINLGENGIQEVGARALVNALKDNVTLTTLALEDNPGNNVIAQELNNLHNIVSIDLTASSFDENAGVAIGKALETNRTLGALHLNWTTGLGYLGIFGISQGLSKNQTLTELNLENVSMNDMDAINIANALKTNHTLLSINLFNNDDIGDTGMMAIAEALKVNHTLKHISLDSSEAVGARALVAAIKQNGMLTSLDIDQGADFEMQPFIYRNIRAHERARQAANALLAMAKNKAGRLGELRRFGMEPALVRQMAAHLVSTRWQPIWWTPEERREAGIEDGGGKRLRTNACIGCNTQKAFYMEPTSPSRVFCSSYCQFIKFHGLPDVRGMSPEQIKSVF